jgi:hypothetical protein
MKKILALTSVVAPTLVTGTLSFGGPMIILVLFGVVSLQDPSALLLIVLAALFFNIILA